MLDALFHLDFRSQCDLATHILKSGSNITMVVDNLEKAGLARRERSLEDRRFINVHLTDKGKKLLVEIIPHHSKAVEDEMSALSSREMEKLGRLCVKLGSKKGGDRK